MGMGILATFSEGIKAMVSSISSASSLSVRSLLVDKAVDRFAMAVTVASRSSALTTKGRTRGKIAKMWDWRDVEGGGEAHIVASCVT